MIKRASPIIIVALAALAGVARSGRGGEPRPSVPVSETLRRVIARVAPGVVRVEVDGGDRVLVRPERRLFGDSETASREGGSGIVLRKDGLVLTHASLVAYAVPRIEVLTGNGRRLAATLVARDAKLDLALLKADPGDEPLEPVSLGTTAGLEPGRLVIALGNPFGVARDSRASASFGVVSAIGPLDAPESAYEGDVIVTDAAVNPGNEGGPLIDLDGRVLGILGPIARDRRTRSVVGFAIPIDAIAPRLESLARGGVPRLGFIVSVKDGALVVERVIPGSPADLARVIEGDRLIAVGDDLVAAKDDLKRALEKRHVGDKVTLSLERDGKTVRVEVELGAEGDR